MSAAVVTGVIRSTMLLGNRTDDSTHAPSSASFSVANAAKVRRATSPFPSMLSHDITVKGGTPRSRRRRSASTTSPNVVRGSASGARSATTSGFVASNSPVVAWML